MLLAMVSNGNYGVSNLGDSCAHLLKQNGIISKLTDDQTPSRSDEYERIFRNNGFVTMKDGVARVDGSLAVSRAIGDIKYKQFLISEPEVATFQIQPDDDVLILASDGLYMVYSELEVARMVSELRYSGHSLKQISAKIAFECCTNYNCKDNVTVVLIDLKKHFNDFHGRARKSMRRFNSQIRPMDPPQMFCQPDLSFYTQMQQKFNPLLMPNQVKQHWSP